MDIEKLFDENFEWPNNLKTGLYERLHDDHDGTGQGHLSVSISPDGDAWIKTNGTIHQYLRFRTHGGGGGSLRVRNALIILAEAIRLDNLKSSPK